MRSLTASSRDRRQRRRRRQLLALARCVSAHAGVSNITVPVVRSRTRARATSSNNARGTDEYSRFLRPRSAHMLAYAARRRIFLVGTRGVAAAQHPVHLSISRSSLFPAGRTSAYFGSNYPPPANRCTRPPVGSVCASATDRARGRRAFSLLSVGTRRVKRDVSERINCTEKNDSCNCSEHFLATQNQLK